MTPINQSVVSQVLTVIKKAGVVTKNDVVETVLASEKRLKDHVTKSVLASERRLKLRMGKQRQETTDLMVKFAETTPTRKEFNALKEQVEFLTPY